MIQILKAESDIYKSIRALEPKMDSAYREKLQAGYMNAGKSEVVDTPDVLGQFLSDFYVQKTWPKGAVQVSQLADEAQVRLQALQVAHNAEIIRLLRNMQPKSSK